MKIAGANMSTFYILNEVTNQYEYYASIGANEELLRSFDADNPEGEFGNAISEKKIIYLKILVKKQFSNSEPQPVK